ncbi:hypothetical protein BOTBODRAFT_65520 [Botryobasidium botryosum FD-172 SS1]|uniref:Uncharacterized protein n=1 Tax=Botryobasidium botryosum (strain FD-172 SS1) TaxID=930990 RepID=A0A067ML62_BOTB1|nr:hypothetical protein BOTBODRAFT_65520 [Botryobasidium botryosum FD-172 SS1]
MVNLPGCPPLKNFIEMRASTPGVSPIQSVSFDCLHHTARTLQEGELEKEWYRARVEVVLWKFCLDISW